MTHNGQGDIRFSSRAKAKACADELNTTKFDDYFDKYTGNPIREDCQEVMNEVLSIIRKHQ